MTKNYYYDGDRLIAEKWSTGAYLLYHYDETGSPYAITYSATGGGYAKYYLIKNLQGDVLQIRNVNNAVVANYEYDAWGRVVSVKYANGNDINVSNHIGVINPIRYRGYYYDSETGFYYLKSRYYDPAICRFISTDGRIDLNDATTNLNLFAYCGNDPVNRIDSEGEFWKELKEIGKSFCEAGIAVVMVATAVAAVGGAITGTIMSGGAAAGTVPLALTLAVECLGVAGVATAAVGATAAAVAEAGDGFSFSTNNNHGKTKGKEFRGGSKKVRDKWYGYENNKPFKKWYERVGKRYYNGGVDLFSRQNANEMFDIWNELGKPFPK